MGDHYAALAKRGRVAEPKGPEMPPGGALVWNAFVRLSSARTSAGFGPNPITYTEIDAYCRRVENLKGWEIEIVRDLDDAFLAAAADEK